MHGVQQRKSFRTSQKIIMRTCEVYLGRFFMTYIEFRNVFLGLALFELDEREQSEQVTRLPLALNACIQSLTRHIGEQSAQALTIH